MAQKASRIANSLCNYGDLIMLFSHISMDLFDLNFIRFTAAEYSLW